MLILLVVIAILVTKIYRDTKAIQLANCRSSKSDEDIFNTLKEHTRVVELVIDKPPSIEIYGLESNLLGIEPDTSSCSSEYDMH